MAAEGGGGGDKGGVEKVSHWIRLEERESELIL